LKKLIPNFLVESNEVAFLLVQGKSWI